MPLVIISILSLSPSEISQDDTETYSVTKLGMRHFIIAAFPRNTFSSTKLTVYACDTAINLTKLLVLEKYIRIK